MGLTRSGAPTLVVALVQARTRHPHKTGPIPQSTEIDTLRPKAPLIQADQTGNPIPRPPYDGIEMRLTAAHLASQSTMILRSGKKNYALLRFV